MKEQIEKSIISLLDENKRRSYHFIRVTILLILIQKKQSISFFPSKNSKPALKKENKISNFIKTLRTSNNIWHYKGQLTDPYNGNKIANVEGIEVVHHIESLSSSSSSSPNTILDPTFNSSSSFINQKLLESRNNYWNQIETFSSRKLFCYETPKNSLGKQKILAPNEQIIYYDTLISFISCNDNSNDNENKDNPALIVCSEFLDRQECILSQVSQQSWSEDEFEYSVYARPPRPTKDIVLPSVLLMPSESSNEATLGKRRQLIQFGSSSSTSSSMQVNSMGSRETYLYKKNHLLSKNNPEIIVRYTRFGECPSWVSSARNRMCTLELIGHSLSKDQFLEQYYHEKKESVLTNLLSSFLPDFIKKDTDSQTLQNAFHEFQKRRIENIDSGWKRKCKDIIARLRYASTIHHDF